MKKTKAKCMYCKRNPRETDPVGAYCTECRLRMAKGEIKSVFFNEGWKPDYELTNGTANVNIGSQTKNGYSTTNCSILSY